MDQKALSITTKREGYFLHEPGEKNRHTRQSMDQAIETNTENRGDVTVQNVPNHPAFPSDPPVSLLEPVESLYP